MLYINSAPLRIHLLPCLPACCLCILLLVACPLSPSCLRLCESRVEGPSVPLREAYLALAGCECCLSAIVFPHLLSSWSLGHSSHLGAMSLLHQSSPLEVTVTPAQSSFFAGEELRCLITFTNRNIPVPASQPLPSTSRFPGSLDASFSRDRRTISDADVAKSTHPRGHVKSQSFDIRSAPGRNGKQRQTGSGMGIREEEEGENDAAIDYDLAGNALPIRKRVIGKHALPFGASPSGKVASEKKHTKSASVAVLSNPSATPSPVQASNTRNKAAIGMGYPSASGSEPSANATAAARTTPGASDTGQYAGEAERIKEVVPDPANLLDKQ